MNNLDSKVLSNSVHSWAEKASPATDGISFSPCQLSTGLFFQDLHGDKRQFVGFSVILEVNFGTGRWRNFEVCAGGELGCLKQDWQLVRQKWNVFFLLFVSSKLSVQVVQIGWNGSNFRRGPKSQPPSFGSDKVSFHRQVEVVTIFLKNWKMPPLEQNVYFWQCW